VKHDVWGIRSVTVCTLSWFSVCGCPVRGVVKFHQSCDLWVNQGDNVATAAAVASIGPTEWLEFLAHDGRATMPTIAALCMDCCLINECRHQLTCLSIDETKKDGPKWTRLPC